MEKEAEGRRSVGGRYYQDHYTDGEREEREWGRRKKRRSVVCRDGGMYGKKEYIDHIAKQAH